MNNLLIHYPLLHFIVVHIVNVPEDVRERTKRVATNGNFKSRPTFKFSNKCYENKNNKIKKNYINHLSLMNMPLFLIVDIYIIYISFLHPRYKYNNQMLSRLSSGTHSMCINFNHDYASWVLQKMDNMNIQPGAIKKLRYSLCEENSKQKSEKMESTSGKIKIPTASLAPTRGRYSLKQWMN